MWVWAIDGRLHALCPAHTSVSWKDGKKNIYILARKRSWRRNNRNCTSHPYVSPQAWTKLITFNRPHVEFRENFFQSFNTLGFFLRTFWPFFFSQDFPHIFSPSPSRVQPTFFFLRFNFFLLISFFFPIFTLYHFCNIKLKATSRKIGIQ